MKATDLMIGDWVQNPLGYKAQVLDIHYIKDEGDGYDGDYRIRIGKSNWGVVQWLEEKDIKPIPITKEILEKNGFKQTDKGGETCILGEWRWGDKGKRNFTIVTITFYKGLNSGVKLLTKIETDCSYESGINMIHSCDIESVHELQHALKLCGIDKEIVL